jgi:hypothetical protein
MATSRLCDVVYILVFFPLGACGYLVLYGAKHLIASNKA